MSVRNLASAEDVFRVRKSLCNLELSVEFMRIPGYLLEMSEHILIYQQIQSVVTAVCFIGRFQSLKGTVSDKQSQTNSLRRFLSFPKFPKCEQCSRWLKITYDHMP